jgi:UDP-N-acetylglucosamine 3-dehydrogenase
MVEATKKPLGLAIIGCGGIAQAHLGAIAAEPRVRLLAAVDADLQRAQAVKEKHHAERACASWDGIWDDPRIEAVDLCLPHYLHAPAAVAALEHGRHVLVEKPIANTAVEADRMVAAAATAARVLMVGHMKRYSRAFGLMKRVVDSGQIGRPYACEALWHGPREIMPGIPWVMAKAKGGGGPLMGFGTHHLDVLRWVLGEVQEVACFANRQVVTGAEVEDTAALTLRFCSGAVGAALLSWARSVPAFEESIRILGHAGEITARGSNELWLASEPRFGNRDLHRLDVAAEAPDLAADPFAGQLAHFIHCVTAHEPSLTGGADARRTLAVIEAAYRSAETGRTVTLEN